MVTAKCLHHRHLSNPVQKSRDCGSFAKKGKLPENQLILLLLQNSSQLEWAAETPLCIHFVVREFKGIIMKKIVITCALLTALTATAAWADAAGDLKTRLDKVSSFHASFTQKVTDGSGAAVQEGQGDLWVKRPNLFNWHMTQPDESILVSDGKTLWFYNPFVEQVSATWLKDATGNTPFMLIARNQSSDWQQYNIKQSGDDFVLTPKTSAGNLKQFTINVGSDGTIHQFSAIEQDDQRSSYALKTQQNGVVDMSKFTFTPPKGVTVDDQRK